MLLEPVPRWTVELEAGEHCGRLGHAWLIDDRIAGCWFTLDRTTGERLWSGSPAPADQIFGVAGGTLVGTEMVRERAGSVSRGIYGISLETGRLLWRFHGRGWPWRLSAWLEALTGVALPDRDGPLVVRETLVWTRERQAVDVRTGRSSPASAAVDEPPAGSAAELMTQELYFQRMLTLPGGDAILLRQFDPKEPLEHLTQEHCSVPAPVPLNYGAVDRSGGLLWERRYDSAKLVPVPNFFGSFLLDRRLLLVERDAGLDAPVRLRVLDAASGEVLEDLPIPDPSATTASIQAVDDRGLLIGLGGEAGSEIRGLSYLAFESPQDCARGIDAAGHADSSPG